MQSNTIQLNPQTLWVENSCTQKHRKAELLLSCSCEVVISLLGGRTVCGSEQCTCRSHEYLLQQTQRAPRIRNRRTEARNYLLSQRTPTLRGRERRITLHLFPVCQLLSREEVSGAAQGSGKYHPDSGRKKEWAMRRRKQEGREGKGALQHHANPEKSAPSGRICLQKSYIVLNLNSLSLAVCSYIKANSNRQGISCIIAISSCFSC